MNESLPACKIIARRRVSYILFVYYAVLPIILALATDKSNVLVTWAVTGWALFYAWHLFTNNSDYDKKVLIFMAGYLALYIFLASMLDSLFNTLPVQLIAFVALYAVFLIYAMVVLLDDDYSKVKHIVANRIILPIALVGSLLLLYKF